MSMLLFSLDDILKDIAELSFAKILRGKADPRRNIARTSFAQRYCEV